MVVLLDTDDIVACKREEALREALVGATATHEVRFVGGGEPRARLSAWALGPDVAVLDEASTGIEHWRDERHDRVQSPERIAFVLHDGPAGTYSWPGREVPLRSGGLYVADLSAPFAFRRTGAGAVRVVQIERSALGLDFEAIQRAAPLLTRSPLYALFRAQVVELVAGGDAIASSSAAGEVGAATVRLARCLLETVDEGGAAEAGPLRDGIALYLRMNFRRRDLSPEYVAYVHNISVRYLFKLWSTRPTSLMEEVYALRLDHARRRLLTASSLSVAAIAADAGFESASHFSRRFRAAYGLSPSELRAAVHGGAEGVH